jgi:hypothetical protein
VPRIFAPAARLAIGLVCVACLSGFRASAASATTFCVHPVTAQHCVGTAEPDLQTALTAAGTAPNNTHANTVKVGNPGTPPASGYSYTTSNPTTNPVSIIGAGQGATTLTYSGGSSSTVLSVLGDRSSVSNLRIVLPASTGGTGLVLLGGGASRVLVTSPGPQSQSLAGILKLQGSIASASKSSLTQSIVDFPTTGTSTQLPIEVGVGSIVTDDRVTGQNMSSGGLLVVPPPSGYPKVSTVRRVRVGSIPQAGASSMGMLVSGAVTANADNLVLRVAGGTGTSFGTLVSSGATLNLNQSSVYGNGDTEASPSSFGIYASASSGETTTLTVRNSIIRNFFYATYRTAGGSGAVANVRYDYSDYDFIHQLESNSSGGAGTITRGTGNLNAVDPGWPNPVAGNFSLPAGSPVINKGSPAPLNPRLESTTDIFGHPRISGRRRDMGAVEFQFPPPRFKLLKGTFDPSNGKVRLPARCKQPAGDGCRFKLTVEAKLKGTVNGKTKRKKVSVPRKGSAGGGKTATLAGKLPSKALPLLAGRTKLRLAVTGTVTDQITAAVALATGHVTLKAGSIFH